MKIDLTQTHDVIGAYQNIDYANMRSQYTGAGTVYCFDVLDGKVMAGYDIKLACFRHLQDLSRQNTSEFPYHWIEVNI